MNKNQKLFFSKEVGTSENFLQHDSVSLVVFLGHKCCVSWLMASTEMFAKKKKLIWMLITQRYYFCF